AIGIDIAIVHQTATLPDNLTYKAGEVSLSATGQTDAHSSAEGAAVTTGPDTGNTIGAGVAITLAFPTTSATVGKNVTLNATGLSLSAGTTNAGGDAQNDYGALATSGAGGGKNSVAGSLAFELLLSTSEASIGTGTTVNL